MRWHGRGVGAVACAVVCLAGARVAWPQPTGDGSAVLVSSFDVEAPVGGHAWLGEGASMLLADQLGALGVTAIGRDERERALEDLRLPSRGALARATLMRVAQLVGASALVMGTVSARDGLVTVTARLVDLETGRLLPDVTAQGPVASLPDVCAHVAAAAAAALGKRPAAAPRETVPMRMDAFEAFVKALGTSNLETRARQLEAVSRRYPGEGRVLLALWDAETGLGNHAAALAAVRAVPPASPQAREARFRAALSLIETAQLDEAFATLRALSEAAPFASVWNGLGVVQLRRGAVEAGRPTYFFHKAAEADPDDPDLCFNLGYAYWREGNGQAALYWLREAVRRNPADADAHFVLGQVLAASGVPAEAARERELARRLSDRYEPDGTGRTASLPASPERLGRALEPPRTSTLEAALVEAARSNQRDQARFHAGRARLLADEGHDADALAALRRALYLWPYDADALLLLGRLQLRGGRPREAVDALRISLWSQESAAAHAVLGQALFELKDPDAARLEAQRALALEPASAEARALMAKIDATPAR